MTLRCNEPIQQKLKNELKELEARELTDFPENDQEDPTEVFTDLPIRSSISIRDSDMLLMKPITCHIMMDPTNDQVEIHLRVEGHLMDAHVQGE